MLLGAKTRVHTSRAHTDSSFAVSKATLTDNQESDTEMAMDTNIRTRQGAASLAFVFDTTGSMYPDLVQAIDGAARILATALGRKENPIYNYILVPFKDPGKLLFF